MLSLKDVLLLLFSGLVVTFDCREQRIPNWLNFLATGAGLLLNLWSGVPSFVDSLYGYGLGMGIFILPFIFGLVGGGDVKLMGALGAILGSPAIPRVAFYSVVAGGFLALFSIMGKKVRLRDFMDVWLDFKLLLMTGGQVKPESVKQRSQKGARTVPYGVAIIIGALLAVYFDPDGHWAGF